MRNQNQNPPASYDELPFWERLFLHFHNQALPQITEPVSWRDYRDSRFALTSLRNRTGLTAAQLSRHLGVTEHTLNVLEMRGSKLSRDLCLRLERIAASYSLNKLAEWFNMEASINAKRTRNRRPSREDAGDAQRWEE